MPGIAGMIGVKPAKECQALVTSMIESMEHETFYRSGTHFVSELGCYVGWVAHQGSFADQGVLRNERGDITLILSGECFVDADTRTALRRRGHELGDGAGGWLPHLYEEEGEGFVAKLNGCFSGVLIDRRVGRAFLFNDRYGLERVYWHETDGAVYFASEAKALLRVLPQLRAFDDEGVADVLTFGCTFEWRTLFRGIRVLPGGSWWSFAPGGGRRAQYFTPAAWENQPLLTADGFQSAVQEFFATALPAYFEAGSKVGVALTGGLDTRAVMACMPKGVTRPVSYTFGDTGIDTLDMCLAARVAGVCGLDHEIIRVEDDFFSDFARLADRTVYVTDGTFGVTGAHEIYLNGKARRIAPVRLTGVFGGEILRGITIAKPLGLSDRLIDSSFHPRIAALTEAWKEECGSRHPVSRAAFGGIPWGMVGSITACRSQVTFRSPYLDNRLVALAYQAPDRVRAPRESLLQLIRQNNPVLATVPTDRGHLGNRGPLSGMVARLIAETTFKLDYLCNDGLPGWLAGADTALDRLHARKRILGHYKYLRYRRWFRRELAAYLRDAIDSARRLPFWHPSVLARMAGDHIEGRQNCFHELEVVLTLEAADRLLIRSSTVEKDSPVTLRPAAVPV